MPREVCTILLPSLDLLHSFIPVNFRVLILRWTWLILANPLFVDGSIIWVLKSEKKHGPLRKTELLSSLTASWVTNGLLFRAFWMAVLLTRSKTTGILLWSAKSNSALKLAPAALDPARDNAPLSVTSPAKREDLTSLATSPVSSYWCIFYTFFSCYWRHDLNYSISRVYP